MFITGSSSRSHGEAYPEKPSEVFPGSRRDEDGAHLAEGLRSAVLHAETLGAFAAVELKQKFENCCRSPGSWVILFPITNFLWVQAYNFKTD